MRFDLDPAKVLYAVGAVFGVAAVLYFARDVVFQLSITVRSLLLFLAFVALFAGAKGTERDLLDVVLYVLSAAAYLAFLVYTLSRFEVDATGTFLALAASSALFVGLGYLLYERGLSLTGERATYVVAGVVVLAALLVGADLALGGVSYSMTVADQVDPSAETRNPGVVVGTATADNRFVFRESIDFYEAFGDAYACVYVPTVETDEPLPDPEDRSLRFGDLEGSGPPGTVPGGGTVTVPVEVGMVPPEREAVDGPIPVERADECPGGSDEPLIVVVVDGTG